MKEITGACRFCGQTRMVHLEADEDIDPQAMAHKADLIATNQCNCRDAKEAAVEMERRRRIRRTIEEIFRDNPEQADFVLTAAHAVMSGTIMKCSIDIAEIKYTFYMKGEKLIFARKKILNHREEF